MRLSLYLGHHKFYIEILGLKFSHISILTKNRKFRIKIENHKPPLSLCFILIISFQMFDFVIFSVTIMLLSLIWKVVDGRCSYLLMRSFHNLSYDICDSKYPKNVDERNSKRQEGGNISWCRYTWKLCWRWGGATYPDGSALHAELPNGTSQDVGSCQNAWRRLVVGKVGRVGEGGDVPTRVCQYPPPK